MCSCNVHYRHVHGSFYAAEETNIYLLYILHPLNYIHAPNKQFGDDADQNLK